MEKNPDTISNRERELLEMVEKLTAQVDFYKSITNDLRKTYKELRISHLRLWEMKEKLYKERDKLLEEIKRAKKE